VSTQSHIVTTRFFGPFAHGAARCPALQHGAALRQNIGG
jgi:hypothetical protein